MNCNNSIYEKAFIKYFDKILSYDLSHKVLNEQKLLTEAENGITYYEIRTFLAVLKRVNNDSEFEKLLDNMIKLVAKLEIRSVPVPHVGKLANTSKLIFPVGKEQ